jgi:peptide/nickel transport system substrate-binding protein
VQVGGTLTILRAGEINGLDPIVMTNSGSNDGPIGLAIFDVLVYENTSGDGSVQPGTADSLTSSDAMVWTLKIHPGIKFSDGTPYDAAAVKFNWQRVADPKNASSLAANANQIASMDVLDSQTLRVTLKAKNAQFPRSVGIISFIGSPAAIQQKGDNFRNDPVGAGSFLFKSWTRNSEMRLVRNPNYWRAPLPYLDQLVFRPIADETQRLNTFKTGGADINNTLYPPTADQSQGAGTVLYPLPINGGINIYFNVRTAPFNDVRARQAVTMALDRADYVKVLYNNLVPVANSIFTKNSPFYDPGIQQASYDPTKAQSLFDQIAQDTGGPLQFSMSSFDVTQYRASAEYLQAKLNSYKNVKVSLTINAAPAHIANVISGSYQAALFGNPFTDPEPQFTNKYTCSAVPSYTGFCDTKFDSFIADSRVTLDVNQRITDLKEAQKIFYASTPSVYLEPRVFYDIATTRVQNESFINDGTTNVVTMWLKTK